MNSITVLRPYWYNGTWVFDDDSVGLKREAFVSGIPEIINQVLRWRGIQPSEVKSGFLLYFSADRFPDSMASVEHVQGDAWGSGNWYQLTGTPMQGWLCPALYCYFDRAPEKIWLNVDRCQDPA